MKHNKSPPPQSMEMWKWLRRPPYIFHSSISCIIILSIKEEISIRGLPSERFHKAPRDSCAGEEKWKGKVISAKSSEQLDNERPSALAKGRSCTKANHNSTIKLLKQTLLVSCLDPSCTWRRSWPSLF